MLALLRVGDHLAGRPDATLGEAVADSAGPVLLVALQPGDCTSYGGFVRTWADLHARGEVRVAGVGLNFTAREAEALGREGAAEPGFPVRFDLSDRTERMLLRLGAARTPVAILLDSDGRPRLVLPSEGRPRRQRAAAGLVRAYVDGLLEPDPSSRRFR